MGDDGTQDVVLQVSDTHEIIVALGANVPTVHGDPVATLTAALSAMESLGLRVNRRSGFYRTPALSPYAQSDYVNSVAIVESALPAADLLALLHRIEAMFGRVRRDRWGPRVLDLDLIDCRGALVHAQGPRGPEAGIGRLPLALPHPGVAERAFVLVPLAEVSPGWRHPASGEEVGSMIKRLAPEALAGVERLAG